MKRMIDLHSHFLPGIDDGADGVMMSIDMIQRSVMQGVDTLVATPHIRVHNENSIGSFLNKRDNAQNKLVEILKESQLKTPKLSVGAEVYLDNDLNLYKGIERLCISGTKAMLIEFPLKKIRLKESEECLYELKLKGIKPIVAHVERYKAWDEVIEYLSPLGVYFQLNDSVLHSHFGKRQFNKIMKYEQKFIISSDMHNVEGRSCRMDSAYCIASKKYPHSADKMFFDNASKVLEGIQYFYE